MCREQNLLKWQHQTASYMEKGGWGEMENPWGESESVVVIWEEVS